MIVTRLLRFGAEICGRAKKEDETAGEDSMGPPENREETPAVGVLVAEAKPDGMRGMLRVGDGEVVAGTEEKPKEPNAGEKSCVETDAG